MINSVFSLLMTIFIFLFLYLNIGLLVVKKINFKFSLLEKLILATLISITSITSLQALLGQLITIASYYLVVIPLLLFSILNFRVLFDFLSSLCKLILKYRWHFLIYLVLVFVFSSTMIFSLQGQGLKLQEVHDSTWHIALVKNLQLSIPPAHPSDSSIVLNNYHYFYDLFLATLAKFSHLSLFFLYYQFSVVFLSSLLLLSAYVLGRRLLNKLAGFYLVFFTALVGSFSYLIPLFNPDQGWHESSFWVSQTLVMIVNPQVIYTLALTYIFILLLFLLLKTNVKKQLYLQLNIILIILISTSIGFKSYTWVILSFVYALFLLFELLKYKDKKIILIGLVYVLVSLPFVWLVTKFAGNSFFYEPMWFVNSMIESPDRVNYLEWKFLQDHYLFKKNWLRFYFIEVKKVLIFYFGNLGIRGLFIFLPVVFLFSKHKNKEQKYLIQISWLVFLGFLFSSIFPLIFLQRGTVWNSIQFWYYALIFANILAVLTLTILLQKRSKLLNIIVFLILVSLAIPTSIKTIVDKNKAPFILSNQDMSFLSSFTKQDNLLICPENTNLYQTSLVRSLIKGNVYLANPGQLELVGSDLSKRKKLEKIFNSKDSLALKQLLDVNQITYVLCHDHGLTNDLEKMLKMKAEKIKLVSFFKVD